MKRGLVLLIIVLTIGCTSNTIRKAPEGTIPRDSMVLLLTDLYIATGAKNQRTKDFKKLGDVTYLVYNKYKIDTTRLALSNDFYTANPEEYTLLLKDVKKNLDSIKEVFIKLKKEEDSISKGKNKSIDSVKFKNFKKENKLEKKLFNKKALEGMKGSKESTLQNPISEKLKSKNSKLKESSKQ